MPYRDNEFYKSVGDGEPTLTPEAVTDEFSQGSEWKSAAADSLSTCEEEKLEATEPENNKKSSVRRIAKMLKLTAAAVVTSAVAIGSFSGGGGTGSRGSYKTATQEWPSITYTTDEIEDSAFTTVYSSHARNANTVQFNVDGIAYRLEDPSKALSFLWWGSRDDRASLLVHDYNSGVSYSVEISGSSTPANERDPNDAYGTISSTTGKVFYIKAMSHFYKNTGIRISTSSELSALMHQLVVRSYITAADEKSWGKLLIGDTLYSDVNMNWSGIEDYDSKDNDYPIGFHLCCNQRTGIDLTNKIATVTVNDIEWDICTQSAFKPDSEGDVFDMVWFVPNVEDEMTVFGLDEHHITSYYSYHNQNVYYELEDITPEIICALAEEILGNYHIAPPEWRR